ncbi:MAG: esterase-like activity of phytase family protein [Bacteriovorax sp.]
MKTFSLLILVLLTASCSTGPATHYTLTKITHLEMKSPPGIGKTSSGQELYLGGFSGMMLMNASTPEEILFSVITDRGPNGYNNGTERPFLLPDYSPQIVKLKADLKANTLKVVSFLKLKKSNASPLTGLPNIRTEENPVNVSGHMISLDRDGMDTESLVSDDEGGYWVGEEYGPSLAHFDSAGKLLRRLTPYNELPKLYSERKANRGFEGIAKDQNRIFGFLQSPIPGDQNFARIVEVDLESMKTSNEYFYFMDKDKERIGDVTFLGNNKFLVIEQNGQKGEAARKAIYKITLNGADKPVMKEFLIDLGKTPFKNLEKIEGIALIDKHRVALVNDNDFQIADKTDSTTGITPLNKDGNEMLILEFAEELTK